MTTPMSLFEVARIAQSHADQIFGSLHLIIAGR